MRRSNDQRGLSYYRQGLIVSPGSSFTSVPHASSSCIWLTVASRRKAWVKSAPLRLAPPCDTVSAARSTLDRGGRAEPLALVEEQNGLVSSHGRWPEGLCPGEDAEKIFYGIDDIAGAEDVIIVEGELDKLAFEVAGVRNVISVPDGAPRRRANSGAPASLRRSGSAALTIATVVRGHSVNYNHPYLR